LIILFYQLVKRLINYAISKINIITVQEKKGMVFFHLFLYKKENLLNNP